MVESPTFYHVQILNGHNVHGGLQFITDIHWGRCGFVHQLTYINGIWLKLSWPVLCQSAEKQNY